MRTHLRTNPASLDSPPALRAVGEGGPAGVTAMRKEHCKSQPAVGWVTRSLSRSQVAGKAWSQSYAEAQIGGQCLQADVTFRK